MLGLCTQQSKNYIWAQTTSTTLGGGTFGKVIKGHKIETGEFVAIKVFKFPTEDNNKVKYIEEWSLVESLKNEFIVRYEAMEEFLNPDDNKTYSILVMELADGTVRSELKKPEHFFGLPYRLFFTIINHCILALEYLDKKKIMHSDVKPGNILMFRKPRLKFKLCDFGGSCFFGYSNNQPMTDTIVSSHDYMASGITQNRTEGRRSRQFTKDELDMWASAACFFECATGRPPFVAEDERGKFGNLHELLKSRPVDNVVCGERKCMLSSNGEKQRYNLYHPEMPLQHYSYSRNLKSILAQFFKRVFAKDKSYLPFERFSGLCQALTSLKGQKYYNVSELCMDEYFDTTTSDQFDGRWFYDEVLGEGRSLNQMVEVMQGIKVIKNPVQFQPIDETNFDKLVVWKSEGPDSIVVSPPVVSGFDPLRETDLKSAADAHIAIGKIVQMQMYEQQMCMFHNEILSFCHSCKQAIFAACFNDSYPVEKAPQTVGQSSAPSSGNDSEQQLAPPDRFGGYDEMDTESTPVDLVEYDNMPGNYTTLDGQTPISCLQQCSLRTTEVADAQEEINKATPADGLFKVNCKLIVSEYAKARKSLTEMTEKVCSRMNKSIARDIVNLNRILKTISEQRTQGSETDRRAPLLSRLQGQLASEN